MPILVVEFYPIDLDYVVTKTGKLMVRIFGITEDKKRIVAIDPNFRPYFYVLPKPEKLEQLLHFLDGLRISGKKGSYLVMGCEVVERELVGRKVKAIKVYVNNPAAIQRVLEEVEKHEGFLDKVGKDVPLRTMYLAERGVQMLVKTRVIGEEMEKRKYRADYVIEVHRIENLNGDTIKDFKILSFDIEVHNFRGAPRASTDAITTISISSNYGLKRVLVTKKFENPPPYVEFLDSEMDMIKRFCEIVKKEAPDVIVSYNGDQFDLPYLRTRAARYRIELDLGFTQSPMKLVRKGRSRSARFAGLVHLDLYPFISNLIAPTLRTETLDLSSVSAELLGEEKVKVDWEELWNMWQEGGEKLRKLVEYALTDAELTCKLCEKLLPLLVELSKVVNLPLFHVSRMSYSQLVESYLMKEAEHLNQLIPNRPKKEVILERKEKSYMGAFVFEPSPGFYKNIAILDFRSLYPTIIVTHNICPTTINCECCKKDGIFTPEILKAGKKVVYHFCKKKGGFIPTLLNDLLFRRGRIKEMLKRIDQSDPDYKILEARDYALKTIANATYGYLGFARARWYCLECAESITAFGRKYIIEVVNSAWSFGFRVIYGDTDSIMISFEGKSKEDVLRFFRLVNEKLPGIMELELRGFYPAGIWVSKRGEIERGAKKKYALIDESGKIIVKGFEFVRRDWANIAKQVQMEVLTAILKENDPERALQIVRDIISKLKEHKVPLEELVIYTQLTREFKEYESLGPHITAAMRGAQKGYYAEPGTIIKWIVIEGPGKISERAYLYEDVKGKKLKYDPEYYIRHQILPAVQGILEVLGFSLNDILSKKQEKLEKFLK